MINSDIKKNMNIVAIVDPPRAGLHKRVLSVLRSVEPIESLVYVSCDSSNKMAQGNLVDLCRDSSKSLRGPPFSKAFENQKVLNFSFIKR